MKKQYLVVKFVMAENAKEAEKKAKKIPVSEIYLHNNWLEKETNFNFYSSPINKAGFKTKKA